LVTEDDDVAEALLPIVSPEFQPLEVSVFCPPPTTPGIPPDTLDPLEEPLDDPLLVLALDPIVELDPEVAAVPWLDPSV